MVTRRALAKALFGLAVASLLGFLLPALRALNRAFGAARREEAVYAPGTRLVDGEGRAVKTGRLKPGEALTVFPEGRVGESETPAWLFRFREEEIKTGGEHSVGGYVAYSKVCTHAGCIVTKWLVEARELECPCHFSAFDPRDGAKVLRGPAQRPLPQLPLGVNSAGELLARGGFLGKVGP